MKGEAVAPCRIWRVHLELVPMAARLSAVCTGVSPLLMGGESYSCALDLHEGKPGFELS